MGYYNVIQPCVVGKLHYARPTTQPIEVDDDTAAPLVESGCLEPYGAQRVSTEERAKFIESYFDDQPTESTQVDGGELVTLADPEADPPVRGPRKRGRKRED